METRHRILFGDAASMDEVNDDTVDLVVTSPPYPMVEMWDGSFAAQSDAVSEALESDDGWGAFEAMHAVLDAVWREVDRVLAPGGTVCVNVGDATRTFDDFVAYPNKQRVTRRFVDAGYRPLPDVVWRKPANSAAKFMGSGTLPPNAYVTLEHESILVFRKGDRGFEANDERRYESAYFWEERNDWFSDLWDLRGERQALEGVTDDEARDRTAAFPFEVPYRLINMYSVYGDTVLDPFAGTGTTAVAAACSARNSVGYEIDDTLDEVLGDCFDRLPRLSETVVHGRLERHADFVDDSERDFSYESSVYGFPVVTRGERDLLLRRAVAVDRTDHGFDVEHAPADYVYRNDD